MIISFLYTYPLENTSSLFHFRDDIHIEKSQNYHVNLHTHSHNFEVHLQKKIVDVKEMLLFLQGRVKSCIS